jgi:ribonuclease P protein component
MEEKRYTLTKSERLCSKTMIERLFAGGNSSFPAYPLRVVYMWLPPTEGTADVSILISVPKKRFKRAVKRNLVKRQVREAYRRNKYILIDALKSREEGKRLVLAFIWLDNQIHSSEEVERKVKKLLVHIMESMQ